MLTIGSHSLFADHQQNAERIRVTVAAFEAPPVIMISKAEPEGMIVELLEEIAKRENWELVWIKTDWPTALQMAKQETIDLIPFVAYSEQRNQFMNFSNTGLMTVWGQSYSRSKDNYENILELENKNIAIIKNDINGQRFEELCFSFEVNCNFYEVQNYKEAVILLQNETVDLLITNNLVGYSFEDKAGIKQTPIIFEPFKVLFASPKNKDTNILKSIDHELDILKQDQDSFYYQIRDKWLGQARPNIVPLWLVYAVVFIIGLLCVSTALSYYFQRKVRSRTADLADKNDQINQIINLIPHMIFASDEKGKIILANEYTAKHFGVCLNKLSHMKKASLVDMLPDSSSLFDEEQYLLAKNASPIMREVKLKDFAHKDIVMNMSKVPFVSRTNKLPSVVTVGVDITEAKAYEEQIHYMAQHDALTGLPNRLLLNDRLRQSLALAKRHNNSGAILFLDLDYFKTLNDSLGHQVGDKLLVEVAKRLMDNVYESDTVARLGGDEFIVQLNELGSDQKTVETNVCRIAHKLNKVISKDYQIEGHDIFVSVSIGIVIYPRDGNNQDQIMQRADTAMYQAKSIGRNRYTVFKKEMEKAVQRRHQIETELRNAVAEDHFFVQYQPQVTGQSGKIYGLEALVRWNHPEQGIIYPAEFIHVAEDSHLIVKLGEFVLKTAFKQAEEWHKKYPNCPCITINLSVAQIRQSGLVSFISELLNKHDLPPNLIELEITESLLLNDVNSSLEIINRLKKLGLRISIDDFGTGFSSLNYLNKLPLDKIKIDRSFIVDIPGNSDNEAIVRTIIAMAFDLGLDIIAEGVETIEQIEFLIHENCHNFQGYYFDSALFPSEIENKYLLNHKASIKKQVDIKAKTY